jgi:hypothetical protein
VRWCAAEIQVKRYGADDSSSACPHGTKPLFQGAALRTAEGDRGTSDDGGPNLRQLGVAHSRRLVASIKLRCHVYQWEIFAARCDLIQKLSEREIRLIRTFPTSRSLKNPLAVAL